MKKLLGFLLVTVMSVGLIACGTNEGKGNTLDNETQTTTKESAGENSMEDAGESIEMTYGKVTNIIGNEIELKLGTLPDMEEEASNEEAPPAGGSAMAMATIPAAEIDLEELELNYTGKTLKATINSGIEIMNMGQKGSLENIKEGTVIGMVLDNPEAENPQVQEIQIIN